jgi:hypothetical protein
VENTTIIVIAGLVLVGIVIALRWLLSRSEDETVAEVKKLIARGEAEKAIRLIDEWIEHNSLKKGGGMGYPGLGAALDHDRKVRKLQRLRAELLGEGGTREE